MRHATSRVVATLLALAVLGSPTTAAAQCGVSGLCCYGLPVITGTAVDAGTDALALRIDWSDQRAKAKAGDVVSLTTENAPVGTRFLVGEVGAPDCSGAPTCPYYKVISELDGGSRTCDVASAGRPTLTLNEPDFIALNARADCFETLASRLGLGDHDFCEGSLPHKCDCRTVDAPTHGLGLPVALSVGLLAIAMVRSRTRRRSRSRSDASKGERPAR